MGRTKKAGYLAVAQGTGSLMAIVIASILSRELEPADYATYRQTFLSFRFVAPFLMMGLPQAIVYFLCREDDRRRGILIEVVSILILSGFVFYLFFIFGGSELTVSWFNNLGLQETLIWFGPYALLVLPTSVLNAALTACDQAKWAAFSSIISQLLLGLIVISTAYFTDEVVTIVKGVMAHALLMLGISFYWFRKISLGTSHSVSFIGIKKMLAYSIPLGIGSTIAYLNMNLDKVIVARFVNPSTYAVYINGAFEVPIIGMLTGAASAIILPDMVRLINNQNSVEAVGLWKRAAVKSATLLFPITVTLWVLAPEIMVFLFGGSYEGSAEIFRIYLLLVPIRIGFFGIIYQACGKSRLLLRRSILALILNLITTVPLTMLIGPIGAALSTVLVSWVVMVPYNMFEASRMIGVKTLDLFAWKALSKTLMSAASLMLVLLLTDYALEQIFMPHLLFNMFVMIFVAFVGFISFHMIFGVWSRAQVSNFAGELLNKINYNK